jgi:hypothetical protein
VVKHPPKARGEWQPHGDLEDLSTVWFEWVRLPAEPKRSRGPLPRRWVAERTIGWLSLSRRMSKDYERLCETSQAMVHAVMSRLIRKSEVQLRRTHLPHTPMNKPWTLLRASPCYDGSIYLEWRAAYHPNE